MCLVIGDTEMSKVLVNNHAIVIPGEKLAEGNYKYGDGVIHEGDNYYASILGLFQDKGDFIHVKSLKGKYIPRPGDLVVGQVTEVGLVNWLVDIGSPYIAVMTAGNASDRRFDPVKNDSRKIFDVGDIILAKILNFDRTRDPQLVANERGLGKLRGGRVVAVEPSHVPRVIGKKGTMINMIKRLTRCQIIIGQNGRIWVNGRKIEEELKAISAFKKIEMEAHTTGLTDRIREMLEQK